MEQVIPLPGGIDMVQRDGLFPLTQDSVLLAGFVRPKKGERALDLGAGQGTLGLMLMARHPDIQVDGLELSEQAAEQANANYRRAGFVQRGQVMHADMRAMSVDLLGRYDLCLSNPPYFDPGRGAVARENALADARCDRGCSPDELCAAADRALRWGGRFFLCYRPDRLSALWAALCAHRLEPKRLAFVKNTPENAPWLFLVEAQKNRKTGLRVEPDVLIRAGAALYGR